MTLKSRTAHSLKWNIIDRVASQLLYAVTGIVLARLLSQEDFGLVGAALVFQAFASLLVDSGFSYALIQRKRPSRLDYSTVLCFNIFMGVVLYGVLYAAAPLIADCFRGDERIVPIARVLFLSIIINATAIVQSNRLMKAMSVRMIAVANSISLALGAVAGITLAVTGYGAWAIVWQTLIAAAIKSLVLWTTSRWRPVMRFSYKALRSYMGVGSRMMLTSFLNTLFQNIYSFIIGNRVGLVSLGYYTQSDKWSKMGITAITQTLTSTFLPTLSAVQDNRRRYSAVVSKINRFTAYIVFPCMLGLMLIAAPVFHTLFGTKWDASIVLFQLLLLRGIFMIFTSLYTNYLLALGHASTIVRLEVVRDVVAIAALAVCLPWLADSTPADPVAGIRIMVWGQVAAATITWVITLAVTLQKACLRLGAFIYDNMPYLAQTLVIVPLAHAAAVHVDAAWLKLVIELAVGAGLYLGGNYVFGSTIQREAIAYVRKKI